MQRNLTPDFENFRDVIKYEYGVRHHKNPAYSLRAFARDLELAPSRLSEIMSGKQGLSPARARIVGSKIGYGGKKLGWFCNLVEAETSRSPALKESARKKLNETKNGVRSTPIQSVLGIDIKWLHFVIRRMTSMKNFEGTPEWISKKLCVSVEKVNSALQDLSSLGLIQKNSKGHLSTDMNIHIPAHLISEKARTRLSQEILYKAHKARKLPLEKRHYGIHYFTIDTEQIEDLKALISEFEDKIDNLTYKAKQHNELMVTLVTTFPLIHSS